MSGEERLKQQKEFLVKAAYWAVWGSVAVVFFKIVGPVLMPFIIAFLVAWVLSRPVAFVSEKIRMNRKFTAVLMVAVFYGVFALFLYLLGSRTVSLIRDVYADVARFLSETIVPMVRDFSRWTEAIADDLVQGPQKARVMDTMQTDETIQVGKMVANVSERVLTEVSGAAAFVPELCVKVLLAVIATVFMELDFPGIIEFFRQQMPERWRETVTDVKAYLFATVGKCVRSYLLILLITFVELSAGFLLLKIDGAFAVAAIIAVLDILPVLGTGTVLIPWTIIAFISGNPDMGIGVLALYLVITVVRNIIEPHLVGRQMGLSPVVMLPCMVVGLHFFGIVGLFGLPFAVSLLKSLNDRGAIHIFSH